MSRGREETTADLGASPGARAAVACPTGYELVRQLGAGGGGTVHLARDLRLDRLVALKFLHGASPRDVERFRREARYTARLSHPGIVQIHETGAVGARPYIAMQYVDGGPIAPGTLTMSELVVTMRAVADALGHAHAQGLVHRDVKPGNILLDRKGRPFVTDFGIARDVTLVAGTVDGHDVTLDGQVIGTPALMAPEQARGAIHEIDARTDIYGLGATMYRLLTGRDAFQGAVLADLLHDVIHAEAPMPRAIAPAIPRGLETIVMRCLEKDRRDRYGSMVELIDALLELEERGDAGGGAWFRRLVAARTETAPSPTATPDSEWLLQVDFVREIASWDADLYRLSSSLVPAFVRLDALRARLDALLEERPDRAWARFLRGVTLMRRGRLRDALDDMERAIDRVPDRGSAHFELGQLYLALHLEEQEAARRHIAAAGVRAALDATRRRLDQAKLAFEEAQRHGTGLRPWHMAFARAAERLAADDPAACIVACDAILADEPELEQVWRLRGDAVAAAGDDPTDSYERALSVRRCYFEALLALGSWQLRNGRTEEARRAFDRASVINPELADCLICHARACLTDCGCGDAGLETARDLAQRACVAEPLHYEAAVTLAEIQLARGQAGAEDDWADRARQVLACAIKLSGCQNRVELLAARVELADLLRPGPVGEDKDERLAALAAECRRHIELDPEPGPWHDLQQEVREVRRGGP